MRKTISLIGSALDLRAGEQRQVDDAVLSDEPPRDRVARLTQPLTQSLDPGHQLLARGDHDPVQLLQGLDTALHLAGLGGLGAEAVHEGLHVGDLALLLVEPRLLVGQPLSAGALEGRVVARVLGAVGEVCTVWANTRRDQRFAAIGNDELRRYGFQYHAEVDAPLDEANGARFNDMIRQMSEKTQFIVVTHNKRTMAAADTLYGVTMAEKGVSKLVGVDIDELQEWKVRPRYTDEEVV